VLTKPAQEFHSIERYWILNGPCRDIFGNVRNHLPVPKILFSIWAITLTGWQFQTKGYNLLKTERSHSATRTIKAEQNKKALPWKRMSLSGGFCSISFLAVFTKSGISVSWRSAILNQN